MEPVIGSCFFELKDLVDSELSGLFGEELDFEEDTRRDEPSTTVTAMDGTNMTADLFELLSDNNPLMLAAGIDLEEGEMEGRQAGCQLTGIPDNIGEEADGPFINVMIDTTRPDSSSSDSECEEEAASSAPPSPPPPAKSRRLSAAADKATSRPVDHHSYSRAEAAPAKPSRQRTRAVMSARRKRKLYELGPLTDPEAEKCRLNAVNAKLNRDKKKAQLHEAEAEISRLRDENEALKAQKERFRDELDEARNELAALRQQAKMGPISIVHCLGKDTPYLECSHL